jgi:mono/diheme cytochrome c family protein
MQIVRSIAVVLLVAAAARGATVPSADSARGERVFAAQSCNQCHSVNGEGGKSAPDLGKRIDRNYTPALLVSIMWNHAPAMWGAMEARGIQRPVLDEQTAADLFAYFYSARFFDKLGDAGRGKQVFSAKHCRDCHGITESRAEGAKPVAQWESLGHPIGLAEAMWNHAANMREAFAKQGIRWPELSSQELSDILVYVRNLRETQRVVTRMETTSGDGGEALFGSKGCAGCHKAKLELRPRLRGKTLTDIAVDMWNHAPKMAQPPPKLERDEMRQIVSYLWAEQLLAQSGNAVHGKQVFSEKSCATCHNDPASGAPSLAGRKGAFSAVSMVSTLWRHGPQMLGRMKEKSISWPRMTANQMSDLIAYLNSGE